MDGFLRTHRSINARRSQHCSNHNAPSSAMVKEPYCTKKYRHPQNVYVAMCLPSHISPFMIALV